MKRLSDLAPTTVNHYLYAIVDRLPARWRPPMAGIEIGRAHV